MEASGALNQSLLTEGDQCRLTLADEHENEDLQDELNFYLPEESQSRSDVRNEMEKIDLALSAIKSDSFSPLSTSTRQSVLRGHTSCVNSVSLSPDGQHLASASEDESLIVWSLATNKKLFELSDHSANVLSVSFSPDGKFLASSSEDKTIKIWDFSTEAIDCTLNGHSDTVWCVAFSPNGKLLASGSSDKLVKLWNFQQRTEAFALAGHSDAIGAVSFGPDNKFLLSAGDDAKIKVWNVLAKTEEFELLGHNTSVTYATFSPDGRFIASCALDKSIKVWSFEGRHAEFTLNGHTNSVWSVEFSPDGTMLASTSSDSTVKIWSFGERAEVFALAGHESKVCKAVFSRDSKSIISAGRDSTIRIWRIHNKFEAATLTGHSNWVRHVCFSPDGKFIASSSHDQFTKVWNTQKQCLEFDLPKQSGAVWAASFSPNNKLLVLVTEKNVKIWDVSEQKEIKSLSGNPAFHCVAFSNDGKYLAVCDNKGLILWNIHGDYSKVEVPVETETNFSVVFSPDSRFLSLCSGKSDVVVLSVADQTEQCKFVGHTSYVRGLSYSKDGRFLASGSYDKTVKIWNIQGKREEFTLIGHTSYVYSVSFSPNDRFLASSSADTLVIIWNIKERRKEFVLAGHQGPVCAVSFSPTGLLLASVSYDKTVKLWNFAEFNDQITINAHSDAVYFVQYSPDGKLLASASADQVIKIWNLTDYSPKCKLEGHKGKVTCATFNKDGTLLASGADDNKVKVWDLSTGTEKWSFDKHSKPVWCVTFHPTRQFLVSASDDKLIKVWNLETQAEEFSLSGHADGIAYVDFSPDGEYLASGSDDKKIKIWDFNKKSAEFDLSGHPSTVWCVKFSPVGHFLASAGGDKIVRLWSLEGRSLDVGLIGHSNQAVFVSFSPNGRLLASGSDDNTIIIWDVIQKKKLFAITGHSNSVRSLAFSPDGNYLASGSFDKTVIIWHFSQILTKETGVSMRNRRQRSLENLDSLSSPTVQNADLNMFSLTFERCQSFVDFSNAFLNIKQGSYSSIKSWNVLLTNKNYTPLHFAALKGELAAVKSAFKKSKHIKITADSMGKSPLFYSINARHQGVTDLIIRYLIESTESLSFYEKMPYFYALRNDFPIIIENSSKELCDFLSKCLAFKDHEPSVLGIVSQKIKLSSYFGSSFGDYTLEDPSKNASQKLEPLKIKVTWFPLPSTLGSESSLRLLNSLLSSTDTEFYKVPIIRYYIRHKWVLLKPWTNTYTALLWLNLVFLVFALSDEYKLYYLYTQIPLISINFILLVWEMLQLVATGRDYFSDLWNFIDVCRVFFVYGWVVCDYFSYQSVHLNWALLLVNIARGVTGFRSFDTTRYYIRLILESLKRVLAFLLIFLYTTIGFGLLNTVSHQDSKMDFQWLWINSFGLAIGEKGEMMSEQFDIIYVTFFIAVIVNVIVMLNMIISILGDSFDEFQLSAAYYDTREMTELILEIEQIYSLFSKKDEQMYLHACQNCYQGEPNLWQGKVVDVRKLVKESADKINDSTQAKIKSLEDSIKTANNHIKTDLSKTEANIRGLKSLTKEIQESVANVKNDYLNGEKRIIEDVNKRLESLEESMTRKIDEKVDSLSTKLDEIMKMISK
jgi:WD40 repeat protein